MLAVTRLVVPSNNIITQSLMCIESAVFSTVWLVCWDSLALVTVTSSTSIL